MADAAHSMIPSTDPLVRILQDIITYGERLDDVPIQQRRGLSGRSGDERREQLSDMLFTATDNLANLRASSPEGAMIQLVAAASLIRVMSESEVEPDFARKQYQRYHRLVYSAVPVLCETLGLDPEVIGLDHFMSEHLDPWRRLSIIEQTKNSEQRTLTLIDVD